MTLGIGLSKKEFKFILPRFTLSEKKRILKHYKLWLKILSTKERGKRHQ